MGSPTDPRTTPTLISSGFQPSTIPGASIFQCTWEWNGVHCHTSTIAEAHNLASPIFWNDMVTQAAMWYRAKRRKNGECYELHGRKHRP